MGALTFVDFVGLIPRQSSRLLPPNAAVIAENVQLSSGEIQQVRAPLTIHTPAAAGPWLAVHRATHGDAEQWLSWTKDVDVAVSPFGADAEPRFYWSGDAEPRYAPFSALPATKYALGVPSPQTAPTVVPTLGTGPFVSRVYAYTYFNALGEESGVSPASDLTSGRVDGTWTVSGFDELPTSGNACTTTPGTPSLIENDGNARHWLRVGDEVTIGASPTKHLVTEIVNASDFKVAASVSGASWARVAPWNTAGGKVRLYRSAGTTATFQLVNEDVPAGPYADTASDLDIPGDELISTSWEPPPAGLQGLMTLPNGSTVGFIGRKVRFSEPFQPHAYPPELEYETDYDVVGLSAFGSTVVAATSGNPFVFDGTSPDTMSPERVGEIWPCLSKRSVVAVVDGVLYASPYGLIYVGMKGAFIWTAELYTKKEWEPLRPETMVSAVAEGRVYVAHQPAGRTVQMLIFNPGERARLTTSNVASTELYVDPRSGIFYIVDSQGVRQWDAAVGLFLTWIMRSPEVVFPNKRNLGAGKVEFKSSATPADQIAAANQYLADIATNEATIAAGDVLGAFGDYAYGEVEIAGDNLLRPVPANALLDQLQLKLFAGGKERVSRPIFSTEPVKLKSGYKSDTVQLEISGNVQGSRVRLAETVIGLRDV